MAPSLLSLPLEVKNEIYEYLLVSSRSYVYPYAWMSPYEQPTGMAGIGLLRVCKQIHAEASAMLYQKNTFMFENPAQLEWFMSQVSDKDINTVQPICLDFDGTQYPREATPTASSARPIVCEQDILAATMTNFRMFIYLMHLWIAPLCVLPESIKHISLDLDNSKFKGTCSHTLANPQFTDLVELVKLLGKERSRGVGIYTLEKNAQAIDAIEVKPMSINELADWHVQMEFLIAELDVDVQRLKRISRTFHEVST